MAFAYDGVSFPMAYLRVGINDGRALLDAHPIGNQLPLLGLAPFLVVFPVTDTQILSKYLMVSFLFLCQFLVLIDVSVNGFVVQSLHSRLPFQLSADLFGREPVTEPGQDGSQQRTFEFIGCALLERSRSLLGLPGIVGLAGLLLKVGQLTADG